MMMYILSCEGLTMIRDIQLIFMSKDNTIIFPRYIIKYYNYPYRFTENTPKYEIGVFVSGEYMSIEAARDIGATEATIVEKYTANKEYKFSQVINESSRDLFTRKLLQ